MSAPVNNVAASDAARRVPATLRQGRIADDPTSLRVVNYFSIGICFYLAATLLGLGIFHLWTGGVSAYASLGANPKSVISRLAALEQDPKNSEYSAFLAAAAVAQRMEHSSYVCLAILLAYTSYMFDFSRKAVLHMAVALWAGFAAFSYHQVIHRQHPWGNTLVASSSALTLMNLLRLVFALIALIFWVLAILSITLYFRARASENAKKVA